MSPSCSLPISFILPSYFLHACFILPSYFLYFRQSSFIFPYISCIYPHICFSSHSYFVIFPSYFLHNPFIFRLYFLHIGFQFPAYFSHVMPITVFLASCYPLVSKVIICLWLYNDYIITYGNIGGLVLLRHLNHFGWGMH